MRPTHIQGIVMKKFYFSYVLMAFFTLGITTNMFAQAKVKNKAFSDEYNRNSITKLFVVHNDSYDNIVEEAARSFNFGEKFDYNDFGVSRFVDRSARGNASSEDLLNILNQQNIGKSIVSFWLNRSDDGTMNDELMQARSLYNTNDGDVMIDKASKVSTLSDLGDQLIKNSYVVVFDTKEVVRKVLKDKKTGKSTISWQASTRAYVYNLALDSAFIDNLYANMWIQDDDSPADKAAKKKLYDDLQLNLNYITSVSNTSSSTVSEKNPEDKAQRSAIRSSFNGLLEKMEKAIPAWQVKVAIHDTHPIRSKIGTKENLKNGTRYRVYKYTEDEEGNLQTKPVGYVRATSIANNNIVATGESPTSRFYQIAGGHLEPGMLMRENKDKGIGISFGAKYHGISSVYLDGDYLLHINNWGGCAYVLLGLGFDYRKETSLYMDLNGGLGYAIPLSRWFEIMPYAKIGADAMPRPKEDENKENSYSAIFAEGGARLSVQPVYPLKVFFQADYDYMLSKGNCYQEGENRNGLGFSIGLRYAF